jgi:hypothetical protein
LGETLNAGHICILAEALLGFYATFLIDGAQIGI